MSSQLDTLRSDVWSGAVTEADSLNVRTIWDAIGAAESIMRAHNWARSRQQCRDLATALDVAANAAAELADDRRPG